MASLKSNLYVIKDKDTGMFLSFGAKVAWASSGAAKNAYNLRHSGYREDSHLFDEQNQYVIVEITFEGVFVE